MRAARRDEKLINKKRNLLDFLCREVYEILTVHNYGVHIIIDPMQWVWPFQICLVTAAILEESDLLQSSSLPSGSRHCDITRVQCSVL